MMDTNPKTERIQTLLGKLSERAVKSSICSEFNIEIAKGDYRKEDCIPKQELLWKKFDGTWGGEDKDTHYWFRFTVNVPNCEGNYRLCFETSDNQWKWDDCDNPQFLVYVDGNPIQSLDWNHRFIFIDQGQHEVYLYAHTGFWVNEVWTDAKRTFLLRVHLVEMDETVQELLYDIRVPFEAAVTMDDGDYKKETILNCLNEALTIVDFRQGSEQFSDSVSDAHTYMISEFYERICRKGEIQAVLTGHAHIDFAWLWTSRQACEKAERTFTTMLELLSRYPEMRFYASSPILYEWVKKNRPALYEKIKKEIKNGKWEADCGAWLEPDMNMPSGESFVRHFLYGKKFLKEEFDIESTILWVPDCFGFAGTLPQIMRGCEINQIVTNKLTWNDMNRMPHDLFLWRGIDGSEVYTYFMTAQDVPLSDGKGNRKSYSTYSSTATPSQVIGAWEGFREKEISQKVHLAFGFGDGGGGPSAEQIEYVRRMSYGIPGVPTTSQSSVRAFIDGIQADVIRNAKICPKWDGELYFEFHRGVFTTVAAVKRDNRKAEFAVQNAEWLTAAGVALCGANAESMILEDCWKKVLEYQFHDTIAGSSIKEVYDDAAQGYQEVFECTKRLIDHKKQLIQAGFPCTGTVIWNHTPFVQSGPVMVENTCMCVNDIPAHGYRILKMQNVKNTIQATDCSLENSVIRVVFDDKKQICSIYDKRSKRELIPDGKIANKLVVYDDFPTYFDAWELRKQYRWKKYELDDVQECRIVVDGCRTGLCILRKYMESMISQTIWMYEDSAQIMFDTEVDWQCPNAVLKTEFPVDVNATRAICDAPYGVVERSITQNTTWEQAKFEVCAHKFVDLSEGNYGAALMSESKYGYSFQERQMELTLLRTPKHPYPEADLGKHHFQYAFYAHEGNFYQSDVVEKAYVFNNPLCAEQVEEGNGTLPECYSFVSCDAERVAVDSIKMAENGNEIVVRVVELGNARTVANLHFGFHVQKAVKCNMLEAELCDMEVQEDAFDFVIEPFEILTFKIYVADKEKDK